MAACGTRSAYVRGCDCDDCREANAIYHRNRRHRYWPARSLRHGLKSTYSNYGCHCELCTAANAGRVLEAVA